MARIGRIIAVTLGLSITGAVFGAFAGALALALSLSLGGGAPGWVSLELFVIPAVIGAVIGGIGAPALAWLLLRHVPLGKAVGWSTVGTVVGGVLGWRIAVALHDAPPWLQTTMGDEIRGSILGALLGFVVTAIILRRRASRRQAVPVHGEQPAA